MNKKEVKMKIVISTVAALLLLGCSENATDSMKETANTQAAKVAQKSEVVASDVKELAKESKAAVEEVATQTAATVEEESEKIAKKVETKSAELIKEAESTIDKTRTEIAKAVAVENKPIPAPPAPKATVSIDGEALYKTCISCHGANAEKKALNKSQVIQGWGIEKTVAALKGYKDGSYGGPMKGIMKPQVSNLSDDEIQALAEHIEGL